MERKEMVKVLARSLFVILMVTCLNVGLSTAQTTGTIYGTVSDATGALIPGADVTASSADIGIERATLTDGTGGYSFALLPVGSYTVSVTLPGFTPAQQTGLDLTAAGSLYVNFELEVGDVTSEIVVLETLAPQVDTANSALGKVIEEERIVDLPLNGRNFLQLGTLQAGVVAAPAGIKATGSGTDNSPGGTANLFSVNGLRISSNNHLLDGANNVESMTGAAMVVPSPDMIQEFRILTNAYGAEYGRAGGSIVTVVTKRGTNTPHGSIYEFHRNDIFDARNFFTPTRGALKQNQFGFTLGGALNKDKTFIFGGYEGYRVSKGFPTNTLVPSLKLRQGDFSDLPLATRPKDPFTGARFPNDQIPKSRQDPTSLKVMELWPEPNFGPDNWAGNPKGTNNRDQFMIRLDHNFGNNILTARYNLDEGELRRENGLFGQNQGFVSVPGFGFMDANRFQNLMVTDTHIFSNSTINELRFAFIRTRINSGEELGTVNPRDYGFTYPVSDEKNIIFPPHAIAPYSALGYPIEGNDRISRTWQISENLSINSGRHAIKMGVDFRHYKVFSKFPSTNSSNFNFNFAVYTGSAFGDFLMGWPNAVLQTGGADEKFLFKNDIYFYFQDDIRLTPRFTLNLGVRYELVPGFKEKNDYLFTMRKNEQSKIGTTLPKGLVRPGDMGVPRETFPTDKNNIGPRVGFAYDLTGDGLTSLRGGYGVFYDDSAIVSSITLQMPPDIQAFYFFFPGYKQFGGSATYADGGWGGASPIGSPPPLPVLAGLPVTYLSNDLVLGYYQHFNLTLQRQITPSLAIEAAYVGNAGRQLNGMINDNQAVFAGPNTDRDSAGYVTCALFQAPTCRRPFPILSDTFTVASGFNSSYHGLQLTATQRGSGGLTFQAAYTFSKAIDEATSPSTFFNIPGQALDVGHSHDRKNDKALSGYHTAHRFVLSYIYELPFLRDHTGPARHIFGGWRANGIISAQTGHPFTVLDASDQSFDGTSGDRPDLVGNPNNGPKTAQNWFNKAAFRQAKGPVMNGTAGRNIVFADGIFNVDFGLTKVFNLTEGADLEFRWEAFNLFNNVNFGVPNNEFSEAGLGIITNTSTPERIMQFALKIVF